MLLRMLAEAMGVDVLCEAALKALRWVTLEDPDLDGSYHCDKCNARVGVLMFIKVRCISNSMRRKAIRYHRRFLMYCI